MLSARGASRKLEVGAERSAAETARATTLLGKLPELSDAPRLHSGGFPPGCAKLTHVRYYRSAALQIQKFVKMRGRPHEASLRVFDHGTYPVPQTSTDDVKGEEE